LHPQKGALYSLLQYFATSFPVAVNSLFVHLTTFTTSLFGSKLAIKTEKKQTKTAVIL